MFENEFVLKNITKDGRTFVVPFDKSSLFIFAMK